MGGHQAVIAAWLVRRAVAMLPAEHRERYWEELAADLHSLPPAQQLGFGIRSLTHAPGLRAALLHSGTRAPDRPVLCRIALHHWRTARLNPEDQRITSRQCRRCGRIQDGTNHEPLDPASMAWVTASRPPNGNL